MDKDRNDEIVYFLLKASEMREKARDAKTIQNKVIYIRLARNYERMARK